MARSPQRRALRKSQSTISTAVANLESDLGFSLFDRTARTPLLTENGQRALAQVKEILSASAQLDRLAVRLAGEVEPCLRLAITDFWQADHHALLLQRFASRYPDIEFECMIAEDEDVIDLLQSGRAHVGVLRAQQHYPPDIHVQHLQVKAQMAIYLHRDHPLAHQQQVSEAELSQLRQLRLNTWLSKRRHPPGKCGWRRHIRSYWRWRNRVLAGVFYRAGLPRSLVISCCANCRWRAGRKIFRLLWLAQGVHHPARRGSG